MKTVIGAHFAITRGMSELSDARAVMALFDGSAGSVSAAVAAIDGMFAEASAASGGDFLMLILGIWDDALA